MSTVFPGTISRPLRIFPTLQFLQRLQTLRIFDRNSGGFMDKNLLDNSS